jgi:hypothetical protein
MPDTRAPLPPARPAKALLAWALCAGFAAAEDESPNLDPSATGPAGAVAQRAAAQEVYAFGMARQDALTVLAAARLALAVALTNVARTPQGAQAPENAPPPPSGADMLAAARTLAGEDETLAGLVDEAEAQAAGPAPAAVSASRSALAPGATEVWQVAFFGGAVAEVAVLGGGPLVLSVTDENGHAVCAPTRPLETARCSFVPAWNGAFAITVANRGADAAGYLLLTN